MKNLIGIWIDKSVAKIISSQEIINRIPSKIEVRVRIPGQGKEFGRFGHQYLSLENANQNRLKEQERSFLKKVTHALRPYNDFVVFGPAQMKHKLGKMMLEDPVINIDSISIETTTKLTDNQLVAYVKKMANETA